MALHWDLRTIKNTAILSVTTPEGEQIANPVTDALIWYTQIVGIRKITEKNAEHFFSRVYTLETFFGTMLRKGGQPGEIIDCYISYVDVMEHVGLRTNADELTDYQFMLYVQRRNASHITSAINSGRVAWEEYQGGLRAIERMGEAERTRWESDCELVAANCPVVRPISCQD